MEAIQELNERKTKILHAIIKNYLETGEPVGSRTISKYTDLNLSSATIRNEMADLEELGYIMQPHTSAGRIPSDKGYRWYVDMLMSQKEQEITEIKGQMLEKADKMEELLKQVAKVLANNTNYATMISTPTYNGNKLKFIQLSQVDDHQLIVVIVMEGNIVKNQIVTLDEPLSNEALLKLNMLLNTSLNGTSLEQINLGVIARLKEQAGIHSGVMSSVMDAVANVIQEIISAFEEKQQLAALVTKSMASGGEDRDIQVYIGDESNVENMKDCSVGTATYELGEGMQGTIGIIGPKRMDYEHVMKTLKTLMAELDDIFHRDEPKKLE